MYVRKSIYYVCIIPFPCMQLLNYVGMQFNSCVCILWLLCLHLIYFNFAFSVLLFVCANVNLCRYCTSHFQRCVLFIYDHMDSSKSEFAMSTTKHVCEELTQHISAYIWSNNHKTCDWSVPVLTILSTE